MVKLLSQLHQLLMSIKHSSYLTDSLMLCYEFFVLIIIIIIIIVVVVVMDLLLKHRC
jgi:hypothetical protein